MRAILRKRALRYVFAANLVSMLGSGMNSAAVAWYILQTTHSEVALGTFAVLATIPAMLLLPFSGVVIDREDRRRLVMMLDSARAVIILVIALLAFAGRVKVWELYLMNMLVAAGFWMFWPTVTALIQELTPDDEFVHANTFLMAGVQGGWLIAGAVVGFVYNHIGLGGVLLIDVSTYVVSFLCYLAVRRGRVVPRPAELQADIAATESAFQRFFRELREGVQLVTSSRRLTLLGISWAPFLGAMLTAIVVTPALSDDVFHAGAVGYGWLNAGWGVGAFVSAFFAPQIIRRFGLAAAIAISLGVLMVCMTVSPLAPWLAVAVSFYAVMGVGRGIAGVAMNTSIMEQVPRHFMGRVQNTFNFAGTGLQIILAMSVGVVAQKNLTAGFALIASMYAIAFVSALWAMRFSGRDVTNPESASVHS
ncbi:MAG: MFS transporter [Acidobacteriales bacterium]|nr:MFS transporter [Terriglobales bacterium]